jgi:hypothetical protein
LHLSVKVRNFLREPSSTTLSVASLVHTREPNIFRFFLEPLLGCYVKYTEAIDLGSVRFSFASTVPFLSPDVPRTFFSTPKCRDVWFDRFLMQIQFVRILHSWLASSVFVSFGFLSILVQIDKAFACVCLVMLAVLWNCADKSKFCESSTKKMQLFGVSHGLPS